MKHIRNTALIIKVLLLILTITFLFGIWKLVSGKLFGFSGEIDIHSAVIRQNLESSKRLEVTAIEEEGTMNSKTSVIILGTVGSTAIR